jgi:hypothetical protein
MTRSIYVPEAFGIEVEAPSGYYLPLAEECVDYNGKKLVYILGTACIDASCCGVGSWEYLRVEGYVVENDSSRSQGDGTHLEIETIEDDSEKTAIGKVLLDKHPGARIEFR